MSSLLLRRPPTPPLFPYTTLFRSRTLERNDFSLVPQRRWRDAQGHYWPLEWTVDVPQEGLKLKVTPRFDDQRWTGSVSYWEGAVLVSAADSGKAVGRGYLELSGYAD